MKRTLTVTVFVLGIAVLLACTPDTAGRNRAIEAALKPVGELQISTGSRLNLGSDGLAFFKKMEAAGFVTVKEVPQDFWGGFATRTFMEGAKPYKVVETQKLVKASLNPNLGGEGDGPSDDSYTWHVQVSDPKLGEVLRDEEYKGPLTTPGEKYRLILAKIAHNPAAGQGAAEWPELAKLLPARLRCIIKYSDFKKEWSVVAIDFGSLDPEKWYSSKVK